MELFIYNAQGTIVKAFFDLVVAHLVDMSYFWVLVLPCFLFELVAGEEFYLHVVGKEVGDDVWELLVNGFLTFGSFEIVTKN